MFITSVQNVFISFLELCEHFVALALDAAVLIFECSVLASFFTLIINVLWAILLALYKLLFSRNSSHQQSSTVRDSRHGRSPSPSETEDAGFSSSEEAFTEEPAAPSSSSRTSSSTQDTNINSARQFRFYPYSCRGDRLSATDYQFESRSANLSEDEPWILDPNEFISWYYRAIVEHPYGITNFKEKCSKAIDKVIRTLNQHLRRNVKAVKCGSLGKGTMLRGVTEVDCVIIVNSVPYLKDVSNVDDYVIDSLADTISDIENVIRNHSNLVSIKEKNNFMLTIGLLVSGMEVEVDLIPTADNVRYEGLPAIYESILDRNIRERELYTASLVKLQMEFIREKPSAVKDLIRMVKYWNKYTVKPALYDLDPRTLPRSYPMELITIYTWEMAGEPKVFDRLQGFKAVMRVIAYRLSTLKHFWTVNYDERMANRGIASMKDEWKRSPLILDPANPTNNVCGRYRDAWDDVAGIARGTLRSNLLCSIREGVNWNTVY
ncbi:2'-5'-oligoadenylate synthase 1A-like isoform X2 [Amphiura filiformis]|uniref:2'-5'-oligoadenylate synthase 1A-like isoform X2 n=1 Tax=Amphiura filiformis TaxID=82378 RepID=UPI003B222C65